MLIRRKRVITTEKNDWPTHKLKDKYGVSWQVVPAILGGLIKKKIPGNQNV